MKYKLRGRVWIYPGKIPWHFITVSKGAASEIKENFGNSGHGFGSIPVHVTIGLSRWQTSIFPYAKEDSYLLPLKAEVRKSEEIFEGNTISYLLEIRL